MMKFKDFLKPVLITGVAIGFGLSAAAQSGSFTSSYDMKAGLYTREFTTGESATITVTTTPKTTGDPSAEIMVYPEYKFKNPLGIIVWGNRICTSLICK